MTGVRAVPYAIAVGLLLVLMTAPVVGVLLTAVRRAAPARPWSESVLVAMAVAPALPLLEMLAFSLLPGDRPLRTALPWAHLAIVIAGVGAVGPGRAARDCAAALRRARRCAAALAPWARVALALALATLVFTFVISAWNAGDEHDGAGYRLQTVMQPYQDGRVGPVPYPWPHFADSYPRTIELLASWTMLCLRSSVGLHLVNWYFLPVLGLAAFVLGRRAGLGLQASVMCGALTVTSPMPAYLTGILYNDLGPGAWLAAGIALSLPGRRRAWGMFDLAGCAAALALGASAKFTVAVGAAVVGVLVLTRRRERGARFGTTAAVLAAAGLVAAAPYLRSWAVYGSPVWPVEVKIGGVTIFAGPYSQEALMITARGSVIERWGAAVFKVFQTTSQDANGAFGLLFAVGVVPAAGWLAWSLGRRPTRTKTVLAVMMAYPLLLPAASNLRYSLHLLPVGYVVLLLALRATPARRGRGAIALVLCVFLAVNVADYGRAVVREVARQVRWGVSLLSPQRNRDWYYQFAWVPDSMPAETYRQVHALMRDGERLVYATRTLGGLLYDPRFRYAVEWRSIEFVEGTPPRAGGAEWIASLPSDGVDVVLVRVGSPEDRALAAAGGYRVVLEQPNIPAKVRSRAYRRGE